MSPLAQKVVEILVVLGAVLYLARKGWRAASLLRAKPTGSCGPDCGCG
jgi:hypothetical protein